MTRIEQGTGQSWGDYGTFDTNAAGQLTGKGWNQLGDQVTKGDLQGTWGNTPYMANVNSPVLAAVMWNLSDHIPGQNFPDYTTPSNIYYDAFSEALADLSPEDLNAVLGHHLIGHPAELPAHLKGAYEKALNASKEALQSNLPEVGEQVSHVQSQASTLSAQLAKLKEHGVDDPMFSLINKLEGNLGKIKEPISQEELSNIAKELAQDLQSLKGLLRDDKYAALTANINTKALEDALDGVVLAGEIANGDISRAANGIKGLSASILGNQYNSAFEEELNRLDANGNKVYTEEQAQKLRMLFNGQVEPGTYGEEIGSLFAQAKSAALSASGMPEGYEPPIDSSEFEGKLMSSSDEIFNKVINGQAPPLTDAQKATLRNMFYGIGGATPNDLPQAIIEQVMDLAIRELGLPAGSTIDKLLKGPMHNLNIQGQFIQTFMKKLSGLPADQQKAVMEALTDPLKNVSPSIRKLISDLFKDTAAVIREEFSLPDDWQPPVNLLRQIGSMALQQTQGVLGLNSMEEKVNHYLGLIPLLPPGPEKSAYQNILKIVMEALADLKEMVALQQMLDAQLTSKLSKAQTDATMDKLRLQKEKMDEIHNKKDKAADMPPELQTFIKVMSYIGQAVAAIMAGPIGIALFIAQVVLKETQGKDMMGDAFKAVFEGIKNAFSFMGEFVSEVMGVMGQMALVYATVFSGNIMLSIQTFFNAGVIKTIVGEVFCRENASAEEKAKFQMAGEITQMVVQILAEIGPMIVMAILSGGAGTAPLMAKIMEGVGKLGKFLMKALQLGLAGVKLAGAIGQAVATGYQVNNMLVSAELVKMRGELDAMLVELDAQIQGIRKFINKLLDGLQEMSQWAGEIQNIQKNYIAGQSEVLDNIVQG